MTTHLQRLPKTIVTAAAALTVSACGSASNWHIDAYNSTAGALIFRVSSSGPAISWRVGSGESILILKSNARLSGQIAVLDPTTCAVIASDDLPIKAGVVSAIYGSPSAVTLEFAPDEALDDRAVTAPDATACP